jgi:site-specific recombinase XerD
MPTPELERPAWQRAELQRAELQRPELQRPGSPRAGATLSAMIREAGQNAVFATEEFFYGQIRNPHTRRAYRIAIERFLCWCQQREVSLAAISPMLVGLYFDEHPGSPATRQQHRAALRHYFDRLVQRHVVILNPVATVRLERFQVLEGKTPEIETSQARRLLSSIETTTLAGLRDRALIGVLLYTAARIGAVVRLGRRDLYEAGGQWMVHFLEKNGKSREIPLRHDLQQWLRAWLEASAPLPADSPLFLTLAGRSGELTGRPMSLSDACRMVKRRMKAAGLPVRLSAHSFRVAAITDLLEQGVPLEEVQRLAGHADPRTTRLYDRRDRRITRNLVERIRI